MVRSMQELSQDELAVNAGFTEGWLSNAENGKRYISVFALECICRALDISPILLLVLASSEDELNILPTELKDALLAESYRVARK